MYSIGAGIFGLGTPELIIILVIALVIFGPKQLPKLGKMFGSTMKEVQAGVAEATKELDDKEDTKEAPAKEGAAGCVSCGAEVDPGSKFCNECGAEQTKAEAGCVSCGAEIAPDTKFCNECGAEQKKADA